MRIIDLAGKSFGAWTVLRRGDTQHNLTPWVCLCECGNIKEVPSDRLRSGRSRSCGCKKLENMSIANTRHGQTKSPSHISFTAMLGRCNNENDPAYDRYGGRGIVVCKTLSFFETFLGHLGTRPEGMTLDRIDSDGNYSCGHCSQCILEGWESNVRWADSIQQAANRRNSLRLTIYGRTRSVREWSEITGVKPGTVRDRLKRGWEAKRAVFDTSCVA